jgi:hypothetical protein
MGTTTTSTNTFDATTISATTTTSTTDTTTSQNNNNIHHCRRCGHTSRNRNSFSYFDEEEENEMEDSKTLDVRTGTATATSASVATIPTDPNQPPQLLRTTTATSTIVVRINGRPYNNNDIVDSNMIIWPFVTRHYHHYVRMLRMKSTTSQGTTIIMVIRMKMIIFGTVPPYWKKLW